eukprot:2341430-Rhodomonas_salina.1
MLLQLSLISEIGSSLGRFLILALASFIFPAITVLASSTVVAVPAAHVSPTFPLTFHIPPLSVVHS